MSNRRGPGLTRTLKALWSDSNNMLNQVALNSETPIRSQWCGLFSSHVPELADQSTSCRGALVQRSSSKHIKLLCLIFDSLDTTILQLLKPHWDTKMQGPLASLYPELSSIASGQLGQNTHLCPTYAWDLTLCERIELVLSSPSLLSRKFTLCLEACTFGAGWRRACSYAWLCCQESLVP